MRLFLLLMVSLALVSCTTSDPNKNPSTGLRPVALAPKASFPDSMPPDVQEYLSKLYEQIQPWWHAGLKKAGSSYKKDHCVHDKSLEAVVVVRFDDNDKPGRRTVERPSGCKLFDETAISLLEWLRDIPPRPRSLAGKEGRLLLRWRFHRDGRGCEPAYAALDVEARPPEERLTRALASKDWGKAHQVLVESRSPSVLAVLAEAALKSDEPRARRLALGIATTARIEAVLQADGTIETWLKGIKVLESRRADAALAHLAQTKAAARKATDVPHLKLLIDTLKRRGARPAPAVLDALLTHPTRDVVLEAFALVKATMALKRVRKAWKKNAGMTGALAVRWCSLDREPAAQKALLKLLAGEGRNQILRALVRYPLPFVVDDLAALIRSSAPAADRVLAIRVLAKIKGAPRKALHAALLSKAPGVQIAASRALGLVPDKKPATTYRLADVARRTRDHDVIAAALAAMARLGVEKTRRDLMYLMARLPVAERGPILANMWAYGKPAVRVLVREAKKSPALIEPAMASLRRIQSDAARRALDELAAEAPKKPAKPAPAPTPLERLLLEVQTAGS
jgi:hypothetical protein